MNFRSRVFWLKNKVFRPEAQDAYERALSYEIEKIEDRLSDDFMKRRLLLEYAYSHCSFYRNLYDEVGFSPSMFQNEQDWEKVPIVEKYMIRENADNFLSDEYRFSDLGCITTGGSTGKPLKLYKSRHVHYEVLAWRALKWWGISPSDNEGIMHRKVPQTKLQKIKNRLLWWPTKRAYLSATAISNKDILRFLNDVKKYNVKWIVGYCASIEFVADYILENKVEINSVKLIWSTSSPLTGIVRKKIERAFKCKVMDQYGCCEMGNIAIQKPGENYLTVNADYVHVDIVNNKNEIVNEEKQYGDILITDLNTKEFPLIKYRLGDRSRYVKTIEESVDGFPKLDFVQGRISDAVWLPNGTYVDGAFLTTICDNYSDYIACYQVYQSMDYSVNISFVLKNSQKDSVSTLEQIVSDFQDLTNHNLKITYSIVPEISDFAGKRKFIISEISLSKLV